jgi:hypothetical protein
MVEEVAELSGRHFFKRGGKAVAEPPHSKGSCGSVKGLTIRFLFGGFAGGEMRRFSLW